MELTLAAGNEPEVNSLPECEGALTQAQTTWQNERRKKDQSPASPQY